MTQGREQPRLLDPGPPESDEPRDRPDSERYAQVIVDQPGRALDTGLTYAVPAHCESDLRVGSYVLVPLAGRRVPGWVTGFTTDPPDVRIRPIAALLVDEPVFDERGLELARWMAEHYLCPLRDALRCLLPPGAGRD
ncbi:MAG: hypothetical protein ACP5KN_18895, partial [Armatimonadota bacterium]